MKLDTNKIDKPIVIVLGGTTTHIELVTSLKKRGYYVVLIDYLESPPAAHYCDYHLQESTLDRQIVLETSKKLGAKLVVSTSVDQANAVAAYVSEKLGLLSFYSYKTAITVTDKMSLKRFLKINDLNSADFFILGKKEIIENRGLNYPLVVKPVDTTGSKGVFRIENKDQLSAKVKESRSFSGTGEVLIEEFINGIEVQCDFFVQNGVAHFLMDRKKIKPRDSKENVLQSVGSIVPSSIPQKTLEQIKIFAQNISDHLEINSTPLFIQCVVKDGEAYILEFALRIGGGLSAALMDVINEFSLVDSSLDALLKQEVNIKSKLIDVIHSTLLVYASNGIFNAVKGIEKVEEEGLAKKSFVLKTPGNKLSSNLISSNRVLAFIVSGSTLSEINKKKIRILELIDVVDRYGNSIMNRGIY